MDKMTEAPAFKWRDLAALLLAAILGNLAGFAIFTILENLS